MFDFPIDSILILLLLACLVGMGMRYIKQPYSIALVLVGLLVAFLKLTPQISLTHDVAFFLILPPILFQGGMHLNLDHLKNDWKLIGFLAVPGVILSTFLVGYPLHYFWHIPLDYALLFGALISPTDPVSVLAILKKIKSPERLRTTLEAESLFNDGTGIVLFMVILGMVQKHQSFNFPDALFQFLLVTGGGSLIGALCGYIIYKIMKPLKDPLLEVTLTVVLTFATPLLAESLHCSGIIAVVVAGLMLGKKQRDNLTLKSRETIENFWEVIDFILNALIFLIIGVQLQIIGFNALLQFKGLVLIGILIVLLARIVVIYASVYGYNRIVKAPIPFSWNHILFWGGLRGTIPIILSLQLPDSQYRPLFLTATFDIVLFSLLVQGLTIEPLLKKLKLQK